MSGSGPSLGNEDNGYICPKSSYYFRCDVTICSLLEWSVSGDVVAVIFSHSHIFDITPEDPLNILIQNLSPGAAENEANFTSYLWFNSSLLYPMDIPDVVTITCSSARHSSTISLNNPGNKTTPTTLFHFQNLLITHNSTHVMELYK